MAVLVWMQQQQRRLQVPPHRSPLQGEHQHTSRKHCWAMLQDSQLQDPLLLLQLLQLLQPCVAQMLRTLLIKDPFWLSSTRMPRVAPHWGLGNLGVTVAVVVAVPEVEEAAARVRQQKHWLPHNNNHPHHQLKHLYQQQQQQHATATSTTHLAPTGGYLPSVTLLQAVL